MTFNELAQHRKHYVYEGLISTKEMLSHIQEGIAAGLNPVNDYDNLEIHDPSGSGEVLYWAGFYRLVTA